MRGVNYTWKENGDKGTGVIAQELEKIIPELVHEDEICKKTVAYPNIVGILIEAIKTQQKQIDDLNKKVDELMK